VIWSCVEQFGHAAIALHVVNTVHPNHAFNFSADRCEPIVAINAEWRQIA
jgi:hypothetical protein